MGQKRRFIIRIGAFVLTMAMLVLFSAGTILMTLPKQNKAGGNLAQFRTVRHETRLKKFEYENSTIKEGSHLLIDTDWEFLTEGPDGPNGELVEDEKIEITGYRINAYNTKNTYGSDFFVGTSSENNINEIIPITKNTPGDYKITALTVYYTIQGSSNTYFFTVPGLNCTSTIDCENYKYIQKTFKIEGENPENKIPMYEYTVGFLTTDPEVKVGERLDISLRRIDILDEVRIERKDLKSMMLSFTNEEDGNIVNVYVKSINYRDGAPHIIIPSTATAGKYKLNYGYLTFVDNTSERYSNTDNKTFAYNDTFVIKEKEMDKTKYEFNNEEYNEAIAKDLGKLDDDAIITVNANNLPLVGEELFKAIQNTKQTLIIEYNSSRWVFNGTDIKNPKAIDVSILFEKLTTDSEYYDSFLKENVTGPSALLKFSDNGDLPGKVLIKIDKEDVDVALNNPSKVYVYYYKEDSDKLVKVAMEIQSNKDFYEFYINHNSKYILTTEEAVAEVVAEDTDLLALNHELVIQQQQQLPITYILATVCGVLAIGLLISLLGKKKQSQQQTQE